MGIFRRVSDIISANLNDLVDRFEDPERMLKQAIREMEAAIDDVTGAAAKAIASERLSAQELARNRTMAEDWQARAEQAVRAADDDRARQALLRRHVHDQLARSLEGELAAGQSASHTLRTQIELMRAKHAEAKRKLASLIARSKAARARSRLQLAGAALVSHRSGFAAFERMRERVDQAEAEADALAELQTPPVDPLDSDTATRDDDAAIEAELAAIKQRLQ